MIFIPMPRGLAATPHPALLAELFDGRPATPAADPAVPGTEPARGLTLRPALDLCESRTAYTLTVDLPGARRESVKVSIDGRRVSLSAELPAEPLPDGAELRLRERSGGARRYVRQLELAQPLDPAASQARLEHGVLTLTLAKLGAGAATELSIN